MKQQERLKIGVLFGGKSGEHEVSISSAASIIKAMDKKKYKVIPIGITKEGCWLSPQESMIALQTGKVEGNDVIAWKSRSDGSPWLVLNKQGNKPEYALLDHLDVIFPVLHGPYGEDGTVQGLLELIDIPYVGCGVAASSVGMDKDLMKKIFQQSGLPQTQWITLKRKRWTQERSQVLSQIEDRQLKYPLFVKPTNLGSSVGISRVGQSRELGPAIDKAAFFDRKIIIEEGIEDALEVECAVLGNDEPEVSLVGEIKPGGEYYDYHSKYRDQNTRLIIPARLKNATAGEVQRIARLAYLAIDAAGLARVDFFVQEKTDFCQIFLNEINTMPGFTQVSMYPKLWEKSGIGFSQLIDQVIQFALERYQDKKSNHIDSSSMIRDTGGNNRKKSEKI